jgi:septal ring factor EnvC (AmiA/AmiB activator)
LLGYANYAKCLVMLLDTHSSRYRKANNQFNEMIARMEIQVNQFNAMIARMEIQVNQFSAMITRMEMQLKKERDKKQRYRNERDKYIYCLLL